MAKEVKINGKWSLILPDSSADEWIGNMKWHNNTWEMPRLLKLKELIDSGKKNVLYIGAYKGDMAALLASWGANLVMVESTPAFWTLIEETWKLNPNLPTPYACFSGLISRQTTARGDDVTVDGFPTRTAEYIEGAVGFTHLAESKDDPTFPQISIDNLCSVVGFEPDIVTMDIEGSELEAMYGAIETLKNCNASYMMSIHPEFMYHNHNTYMRELFDVFGNHGYSWEFIDYDHELHFLFERTK